MTVQRIRFATLFMAMVSALIIFAPKPALASNDNTIAVDINSKNAQEITVSLPDGTEGALGLAPVNNPPTLTRASYDLGNGSGTWKVYWYTAVLNTSYMVQINNYNIVRCYDNYSSGIGVLIDSCTLNWGSKWSTQTTRHHEPILQTSDTRFLKGNISESQLVTSVHYG